MERVCRHCGAPVVRKRANGPWPEYCSPSCRGKACYARTRETVLSRRAERYTPTRYELTCETCGIAFIRRRRARFCGERCREIASPLRCANHPDRPVRARGLCSTCYNDAHVPDRHRRWPGDPEIRRRNLRAKTQRRRAATRGGTVERFTDAEIFERDGWRCGICRRPVDRTLIYPHPRSASLDHVVPLSEDPNGHTRANVRCSHLICNTRRSNRGGGEQLALVG